MRPFARSDSSPCLVEPKRKKGAAAAEDQGTPGDAKKPPAPDASSAVASRDVVDDVGVDHMSGGWGKHSDITSFSQDQHQSHVQNPDDIDAMDKQLPEYAGASSLTPEQRHHALRILIKRALFEEGALQTTPAQILSLVGIWTLRMALLYSPFSSVPLHMYNRASSH